MKKLLPLLALFLMGVVQAANVPFSATLATTCTLTVNQPGVMAVNPIAPGIMSTSSSGGSPGVVGVSYLGTPTVSVTIPNSFTSSPTLTFTPTFSGSAISASQGTFTFSSGVGSKSYPSGSSDTITLDLMADAGGSYTFPMGNYSAVVVVSCS